VLEGHFAIEADPACVASWTSCAESATAEGAKLQEHERSGVQRTVEKALRPATGTKKTPDAWSGATSRAVKGKCLCQSYICVSVGNDSVNNQDAPTTNSASTKTPMPITSPIVVSMLLSSGPERVRSRGRVCKWFTQELVSLAAGFRAYFPGELTPTSQHEWARDVSSLSIIGGGPGA
jgi:hypothetical protein